MTLKEKQEKLESLRAKAKDYQAELGYLALSREALDARWNELKQMLKDGERDYRVAEALKAEDDAAAGDEVRT